MYVRVWLILITICISASALSQKVIGAAMADDHGITDQIDKAKYLIVEKRVNDSAFERLDYHFAGSMIQRATYQDKNLSVLNGLYFEYGSGGYLATSGQYVNGKRDGLWYAYDDTAKIITKYTFHLDTLLSTIDMDSLAKADKKKTYDTTGDVEAVYKGGNAKIGKIISSNFDEPDRTVSLQVSGTVRVRFVISTEGKPKDLAVVQSVEFAFDEEALRVVSLLNKWIPASEKGRKVNAYRIQPITLAKP
jgi:protein TonB